MERQVRILGAVTTAVMLLAGCGGRADLPGGVPAGYDPYNPGYGTTPGYGSDPYNPGYGTTPGYGNDPYNPGYGTNPGTNPYNPGYGTNPQPLIAKVDNVKNGSFLGLGRLRATVTVMNPSSMAQSGTLKVSILAKGSSIKDFTERVTIQPGQSITKTYEDSRWKADDCTASIIPDNLNGGDPYGGGYGNGGGYGQDPYNGGGYGNGGYGSDPYGGGYGNDPYGGGNSYGGYY